MSSTSLKWALWLAERGFKIGPLPEGSKVGPALWKDIYTTDADRIRTWFELTPNMNYLVCPGESYGIIDLDMGEDKDGIARWEELELSNDGPTVVDTFTVETWSGGRHIYYKVPEPVGNSVCRIAYGVDVRGQDGYVVGPGSKIEGKPYTVTDPTPMVDAPDWVYAGMSAVRGKSDKVDTPKFELDLSDNIQRAKDMLSKRDPAIEGHGGDEHTYVTFCRVRDLGISQEKALELVTADDGWNERCEPPWDYADLEIKAENAYSFAKDQQGSKGGVLDLYEPDDMVDVTDLIFPDDDEEDKDPFSEMAEGMLRGGDIWKADTYQRYIIPEWLPDSGYVAVLARRGVGKSTVMIDMASCIATDMDWHGWPVLKGYHAIYLCGEHDAVALQLLRAWKEHNLGVDVADNNRFIFFPKASDLLDIEKTKLWVKFLRQQIGPEGKAVIFVDTWQRATSTGSQNDDLDMQRAVHNAERLGKGLDGPVIAAFHPPKADGEVVMGSSIIENDTMGILTLTDESGKRLEVTRAKGRGEGNFMTLQFEILDLGEEDEHGRVITGQAVSCTGGTNPVPGEADVTTPDSPTAISEEDKVEHQRQVFGKFLILLQRNVRSEDGMAKAKLNKDSVAKKIIHLRTVPAEDRTEIEKELFEAGGDVLFTGAREARTYTNLIDTCFVKTKSSVSVEMDGKHWDVGFLKQGNPVNLIIKETV